MAICARETHLKSKRMSKLRVWIDYLKSAIYVKHIKFYVEEIVKHIDGGKGNEPVVKELCENLQAIMVKLTELLDKAVEEGKVE